MTHSLTAALAAAAALAAPGRTSSNRTRAHPSGDYQYTVRVAYEPSGKTSEWTVRVHGDEERIDPQTSRRRNASYILVSDSGRTVTVVHPRRHAYETRAAGSFINLGGTTLRAMSPELNVKLSGAGVTTEPLGSGGRIAGRRTERVRVTARFTTKVGVAGFSARAEPYTVSAEYWCTPGQWLYPNPLVALLTSSGMAYLDSDTTLAQRFQNARDAALPGTPVRTVVTSAVRGSPNAHRSVAQFEIRDLRHTPEAAALFQLPAGYRSSGGSQASGPSLR